MSRENENQHVEATPILTEKKKVLLMILQLLLAKQWVFKLTIIIIMWNSHWRETHSISNLRRTLKWKSSKD